MILHHVIFSTNKKQTLNFILFCPIICNICPILQYYKLCLKDWSQIAKNGTKTFGPVHTRTNWLKYSSFTLALIWDLAQCFRLHWATVHPDWTSVLCFFLLLFALTCIEFLSSWVGTSVLQQAVHSSHGSADSSTKTRMARWNPWISLAPGNS